MQLTTPWSRIVRAARSIVLGLVALSAFPSVANAGDETVKASSELAVYQDSFKVSVFTPTIAGSVENPTAGWAINGRYLVDVVSAASPDIVSTASPRWSEVRHAGSVGASYKPGTFGIALNSAISSTPDYLSLLGGGAASLDLDEKNWTLLAGYTFGRDRIGRTGTPFSVFSRTLDTHLLTLGVTRVINPSSLFGIVVDATLENGDQSKPYRYIPLFDKDVAKTIQRGASPTVVANSRLNEKPLERLPLERTRVAVTARYALRNDYGTFRAEERMYTDTWGLLATTTDVRYMFDLSRRVIVWPRLRFHAQSAVNFWERAYVGEPGGGIPIYRAGDRELGALITVGTGLGARWMIGKAGDENDIALTTSIDGYWTRFADALFVTERFSTLGVVGGEVTF